MNRPGAALRLDFLGDSEDDEDDEYPALGRFIARYITALFEFVLRFEAFRGFFSFFRLFFSSSLAKYNSCEKFVNFLPRLLLNPRNLFLSFRPPRCMGQMDTLDFFSENTFELEL